MSDEKKALLCRIGLHDDVKVGEFFKDVENGHVIDVYAMQHRLCRACGKKWDCPQTFFPYNMTGYMRSYAKDGRQ